MVIGKEVIIIHAVTHHIQYHKPNQMSGFCKDCGIEYDAFDGQMVMLKDRLWSDICDKHEDVICADCIEKRMGRKIEGKDLKWHKNIQPIPVNIWFAERKCLKYIK